MTRVALYDTTLRDGTQREGLSLSCDDKLRIARKLDELGVAFIEAGWPGSNPKDAEVFARARAETWRAEIVAFGSTRRAGLRPEHDPGLRALLDAGTRVVTVFGKSSLFHVTDVLRVSPGENLAMIAETIAFLRAHDRRVIYDAEHFFDGYALDPAYALETLRAAAGAETIVLCDTNGGMLPFGVADAFARVRAEIAGDLGIHAHDDAGCAVANSLAAVRAGARHVQGTINGYGERCGNANLCIVAPDLELKEAARCLPDLARLAEAARFVAEVANLAMDEHMPYVGRSAFAHKGGVHVAAMRRHPASYQHVPPERVGNASRVVVSELSGRGNVLAKAEEYGIVVGAPEAALAEIKAAEARGASFEAAEASAALVLARGAPGYRAPFELVEYRVFSGSGRPAEATLKLAVAGEVLHTAAEGNGPVSALDAALRKALVPVYPELAAVTLVDYKVRILDGARGTAATVRVLIDSTDGRRRFSAVGAGTDILAASWAALADSMEFALFRPEVGNESEDRPSAW
ncbi:MAG TPA: citramalate synthase [Haliangiales bacterium]|nr:citramalate synthase [Haliangiales bacterium]